MPHIPENVRQVLIQLLPAHIINDVKCYVFYDNHPEDKKDIDVTVYTTAGEVKEYFQRDMVSYVNLENMGVHTEIKILRNSQCELYYLVAGGGELTILSRKDKLEIHQSLTEVSYYKMWDSACSGEAILHVVLQYSEIPIVPDDNFENFTPIEDSSTVNPQMHASLIRFLKRKLVQSKYSVCSSEKAIKDFTKLRQELAYATYKKIHPNYDDSVFKDENELGDAFKIFTQKPWIKTCNKKIVIICKVCNGNEKPLEEVQILLHGTKKRSIEYTTKIFEKVSVAPGWRETHTQILLPNVESAVVVVLDLEELKDNIISRIEFDGVLIFKKKEDEEESAVPVAIVTMSSFEAMGEQFDALSNDLEDTNIMLAVLATTEKTDLVLRHLKELDEQYVTIDIFCKYLQMERVPHYDNIVIHRKSPYHTLNGVMIILDPISKEGTGRLEVSVYSRSSSQILALLHQIQDAVPFRILTTTSSYKIISKIETYLSYNENLVSVPVQVPNYMGYVTSMLNRTGLVIEYLDNSMIHMSESKDPAIRKKIDSEIDLFAQGEVAHVEFKQRMWDEAAKGVEMLEDLVSTDCDMIF